MVCNGSVLIAATIAVIWNIPFSCALPRCNTSAESGQPLQNKAGLVARALQSATSARYQRPQSDTQMVPERLPNGTQITHIHLRHIFCKFMYASPNQGPYLIPPPPPWLAHSSSQTSLTPCRFCRRDNSETEILLLRVRDFGRIGVRRAITRGRSTRES